MKKYFSKLSLLLLFPLLSCNVIDNSSSINTSDSMSTTDNSSSDDMSIISSDEISKSEENSEDFIANNKQAFRLSSINDTANNQGEMIY